VYSLNIDTSLRVDDCEPGQLPGQRIRGSVYYALYKCTFYLLTYFIQGDWIGYSISGPAG